MTGRCLVAWWCLSRARAPQMSVFVQFKSASTSMGLECLGACDQRRRVGDDLDTITYVLQPVDNLAARQ